MQQWPDLSERSAAGLAGIAAGVGDDAGLVARDAHRLEALHTLAAGGRARRNLGGIGAGALHGGVAVQRNGLVVSEAGGAALARLAGQHEGSSALDVSAARHGAACHTLVVTVVNAGAAASLTHELSLV